MTERAQRPGRIRALQPQPCQTTPEMSMTIADAARDRLRSMALSLATGSGELVDPRSFNAALDEYRDALLAQPSVPAPSDRTAVLREAAEVADSEAVRLYDGMGQEEAAGARLVGARLRRMADEAQQGSPTVDRPHRRLIARLEADRASMLAGVTATDVHEIGIGQSGLAAGALAAILHTLRIFEGEEAAERYISGLAEAQADEARQAGEGDATVAYRDPESGALYCTGCGFHDVHCPPVTADDLPDGGLCADCGIDVLIEQAPTRG